MRLLAVACILLAVAIAACGEDAGPTGPDIVELYTKVCVDSVWTTDPPLDCSDPPDGYTLTITIKNPFADD